MTPAERAARYIKAAKLIETGQAEYCCIALERVNLGCIAMQEMFAYSVPDQYWGSWMRCWGDSAEEARDNRVLGLCFMACVVRRP